MFNKRRRSYRKGPPANQIYVPHDQRKLTNDPIPIMNESQAQFYYKQLKDMGYIPTPEPPRPLDVIKIKMTDPDKSVLFNVDNQNQHIKDQNFNSTNCQVYDVYDNPIPLDKYDLVNIVDENGYYLFPILAQSDLRMYNGLSSSQTCSYGDIDTWNGQNTTVAGHSDFKVSESFPWFTAAYVGATANRNFFFLYGQNTTTNNADMVMAPPSSFYLKCDYLTCLVFPA